MKKTMLFFVVISFFLLGCSSELPPEPGAPGDQAAPVGKATEYSDAYGTPFDPISGEQFFFLDPMVVTFTSPLEKQVLNVRVSYPSALIYYRGYVYTKQGWKDFNFGDQRYKDSNWIRDEAKVDVGLLGSDFYEGENYVVVYACKLVNSEWKCGWDGADKNYRWSLNSFILRYDALPPEPIEPGSLLYREVFIWPNYNIFKPSQYISLGMSLHSTQDEWANVEDELSLNIGYKGLLGQDKPETYESVTVKAINEGYCYDYEHPSSYYFSCWRSYDNRDSVSRSVPGIYSIEFPADPSLVRAYNGEFAVAEHSVWSENIIENNIDQYVFEWSYGYYQWLSETEMATAFEADYEANGLEVSAYAINNDPESLSRYPDIFPDLTEVPIVVNGYSIFTARQSYSVEECVGCPEREIVHRIYFWKSGDRIVLLNYQDVGDATFESDPLLLAYLAKHVPDSPPSTGDTCTETPEDFFVKETVTINKRNGEEWTRDDECMLDGRVQEVLCMDSGDYAGSKNYGASYLLCPFGCSNGACLWDTSCTSDADCQLVNKDLGVLCCYEGQCDTINYYDEKWIAVNKETYDDARGAFCPTTEACGPAPGCPSSMIDTDARAACIQEVCQKVSGVAASSE